MATNKAVAAALAVGLAAGTGGTATVQQDQIDAAQARAVEQQQRADAAVAVMDKIDAHNPTIKTYVRNAATQTVTDVLDDKVPAIRADQLHKLVDDIEADIAEGETAKLSDLVAVLAGKVRLDDPEWQTWFSLNFATYLQAQLQTGTAVGNLDYDQLVRIKDATDAMRAVAVLHTPIDPVEIEAGMRVVNEAMREYEDMRSAEVEAAEKSAMLESHGGYQP